jgi:tetratricopeptide (TPR) repeat protein
MLATSPLARQIIADPAAALADSRLWSPGAVRGFCRHVSAAVLPADPPQARRLAAIAVRLAGRSRSASARAHAWCTLGACLRYAGRLRHAESCYILALGEGCASMLPEIFRRWSYVPLYRDRYKDALWLAQRAVRGFLRAKDLHGAGRALLARGLARERGGDRAAAYEDYCEALSLIPRYDDHYYAAALQNLTSWLSTPESTEEQLEQALTKIAEARWTIRKHQGYRILRTRLRWVEVLILLHLRRISPYKVRQSLERVVRVLTEMEMPQDAAAAAADLAVVCARHCLSEDHLEHAVVLLCDDLAGHIAKPLRPLVGQLRDAARAIDPRPAIRDAAKALRDACQGHGIPAPVGVYSSQ